MQVQSIQPPHNPLSLLGCMPYTQDNFTEQCTPLPHDFDNIRSKKWWGIKVWILIEPQIA